MTDEATTTERPTRRRVCEHGTPLGACDIPECPDYAGHRCLTIPCAVVGCINARPAPIDPNEAFELGLRQAREADGPGPNPADFPPEAVTIWEETQRLSARESSSSAMPGSLLGRDEASRIHEGNSSWEWRPPIYCAPDPDPEGRDLDPLEINGKVRYQPAPPIHSRTARPGTARDLPRRMKRMTERQAQQLGDALDKVPRAAAAAALDMTRDQLRRAITKRNKAARSR